jgi:hypothetical protein
LDHHSNAFYREQEARCRRLAGASPSRSVSKDLLRVADDYHKLAEEPSETPQG